MKLGVEKGQVELQEYTEEWKKEFENEYKILNELIGNYVLKIEHIGSTSIKGMIAKPIIDIAIVVDKLDNENKYISILKEAGYEFRDDNGEKGEHLFKKVQNGLTTHFLHVIEKDSERWFNYILFKKHFEENPEDVNEYIELKRTLAEKYKDDRKSYTANKNDYIKRIIEKEKERNGIK